MIDNYATAMELMEKMKARLPIPVFPKKPLVHTLRDKRCKVTSQQMLFIKSVIYLGDEAGITCDLGIIGNSKEVVLCPLTHLSISPRHALAKEIRTYQRERTKKLERQNCTMFN